VTKPRDSARFEDHFWNVHLHLAKKIPGLRRVVVHHVQDVLGDGSDLHAIVELQFESREAYEKALSSPEMRKAQEDGAWLERETGTEMSFRYLCETREVWTGGSYQGIVVRGRGLGAKAMETPMIQQVLNRLTEMKIVPGTLNVLLARPFDGTLEGYLSMQDLGGSLPGVSGRKGLRYGEVRIAGRFHGFLAQGDELDYPANQVEIISDHNLRETLGLKDGDTVEFSLVA